MRPKLLLFPGKEKVLLRHHPWIFSRAICRKEGNPQSGDLVDIFAADGTWMAVGHYQEENIAVKVLSYDTADIDDAFWHSRFASALQLRWRLGLLSDFSLTNSFRLVNAEGDNMPGLIVDYYNGAVVFQAHSVGMHRMLSRFCEILLQIMSDSHVPLTSIFDKSSATLPIASEDGYLYGDDPEEWEIKENGSRMLVNFREGQKTGSFLDQRENHALLSRLSKGSDVLNTFGYTGGFSLAALKGGARYVETVDISKRAIELCQRNIMLNYSDAPCKGVVADVMHYLDYVPNTFDIIILDPPAFAKTHRTLQQGLKGYHAINHKAMVAIKPGGLLFTFSCSQAVSRDDFRTMAFSAAATAHRKVRVVRALPHAMDHPVSIFHPEGEYLKGLLLEVE